MSNRPDDRFEKRIRFVAKHYSEEGLDADKAWKKFSSGRNISRRVPIRRYITGVAAVMLILVGIGTLYFYNQNAPEWIVETTLPGQQKNIYLPDSSQVILAGNSSIRYDRKAFRKERRDVEMNGKAFYQVQKDETRPFSVSTRYTKVVVLGTSFQLTEDSTSTNLRVQTGKVQFVDHNDREQLLVMAGMSARYSADQEIMTIFTEEDPNAFSLKTRQLIFHDTPLDKVISDLSEYYQVPIRNRFKTKENKLTATFNDLPLEEVLLIINQTLDTRLAAYPSN